MNLNETVVNEVMPGVAENVNLLNSPLVGSPAGESPAAVVAAAKGSVTSSRRARRKSLKNVQPMKLTER